jgi:hypothetical protein
VQAAATFLLSSGHTVALSWQNGFSVCVPYLHVQNADLPDIWVL